MITDDQVRSFVATFAPEIPVLTNFVDMCQVSNCVAHCDEDCQTCPDHTWPLIVLIILIMGHFKRFLPNVSLSCHVKQNLTYLSKVVQNWQ
jgi:hypothetical protein